MNTRQNGFTLVELLVVFAVIGVLAAILLPAVQATRDSARKVACRNNLHQIVIALHQYHDLRNSMPSAPLPGVDSWAIALLPFIEQRETHADLTGTGTAAWINVSRPTVYHCPSSSDARHSSWPSIEVGTYGANAHLLGNRLTRFSSQLVVFQELPIGHELPWPLGADVLALELSSFHSQDGGNIAFADGSVRWMSVDDETTCFLVSFDQ